MEKQKPLSIQLAESRKDSEHYRDLYYKACEQIKELKTSITDLNGRISHYIECEKKHNSNLLEIVRWQANPETTKHPFRADKSQRDPNEYGNHY